MISYRFKRRAFLGAIGGGLGLKIMLRNMEASAQGMTSPPRLLVTHWPVGIVAGSNNALWAPTVTNTSVMGSPGLQPFADKGLGPDMTVFRGISTSNLNLSGGGSHEQGTVSLVTGRAATGSRDSCCEGDDAFAAAGGSFEQLLLRAVPALQAPGKGIKAFANSIADSRTDFAEWSTQTLSYDVGTENVRLYRQNGATKAGAIALRPELSPLTQFNNLFSVIATGSGGTTGGGTGSGGTTGAAGAGGRGGSGATTGAGGSGVPIDFEQLKRLACKKNVLDFAMEELNLVRAMGPADARNKLNIHYEEVMAAQGSIANAINVAYPNTMTGAAGMSGTGTAGTSGTGRGGSGGTTGAAGTGGGGTCAVCATKPGAPPSQKGGADPMCTDPVNHPENCQGTGNNYGNDGASSDDSTIHAAVAKAHLDVLKAAFVCDLIRVGTFQYSPGTNHVAFRLFPGSQSIYQHHPLSHRIGTPETVSGTTPAALNDNAEFLYNVQKWYFEQHATNLATWKTALDSCGNPLLDHTIVPFVTEVRATGHERSDMAAMIIGGKALGFAHNKYIPTGGSINQFWGTIAAKLGYANPPAPFAGAISGV